MANNDIQPSNKVKLILTKASDEAEAKYSLLNFREDNPNVSFVNSIIPRSV